MGATEDGFAAMAAETGICLERRVAVAGLSSHGHADLHLRAAVGAATQILADIHGALGGSMELLAGKRRLPRRVDFLDADAGVVVEVDEIQHFTSDRLASLKRYVSADVGFDVGHYIELCHRWSVRADRYRASKPALDFPGLAGRRRQRAYFDAVRDLAVPLVSPWRVLRVPVPECDPGLAVQRYVAARRRLLLNG